MEIAAINSLVDRAGIERFHLFGFSAGATVALATTLAMPDRVLSVTLLEPATIGADAWHPVEAAWQAEMLWIRGLSADVRTEAFRQLLMRPGIDPPPPRAPSVWTPQDDMLENMLEQPGFVSSDLTSVAQPTLVVICGQSNPRWKHLADRLVAVMPNARTQIFPALSHFTPPYREEPEGFEDDLIQFWLDAEGRKRAT